MRRRGIRRLTDSEYSTNTVAIGNNETNGVRPPGFHSGLPFDQASRHLTAFMAMGELYQWTRVAMGLKGSGPYFQRSMSNTVLAGRVYQICEPYIDDVLIHGWDLVPFLHNVHKVFERLREFENKARTSGRIKNDTAYFLW